MQNAARQGKSTSWDLHKSGTAVFRPARQYVRRHYATVDRVRARRMAEEILIGAALLLIPAVILLIVEVNVARKRRAARDVARRNKARPAPADAKGEQLR